MNVSEDKRRIAEALRHVRTYLWKWRMMLIILSLLVFLAWLIPESFRVPGGIVLIFVFILVVLPKIQIYRVHNLEPKERFDLENEARKTLAQILGGILVISGLYYSWQTLLTSQDKQITDLFSKAVEQLGSDKVTVRVGGIYALERIAKDSEKDYPAVVEILSSNIREYAPYRAGEESSLPSLPPSRYLLPGKAIADIQAAVVVLSRASRRYSHAQHEWLSLERTNLAGISLHTGDLHTAHLVGSNLSHSSLIEVNLAAGHLREARLVGARLQNVCLEEASLDDAILTRAELHNTNFRRASLNRARLDGAHVHNCDFTNAELQGADFTNTIIKGSRFLGANLTDVRGLTKEQLDTASFDEKTKLPDNLKK